MIGGLGNDTYYVEFVYDSPIENTGEGTDKLYASSSFDAPSNLYIEEYELTGTGNNYLYGSNTDEKLIGNSGNNRLDGRNGSDILVGGAGADTFVFDTAISLTNIDSILDFSTAVDKIELSRSVFQNLNAGSTLNASAFQLSTAPVDADDRIIYDISNGYMSYDRDGTGSTYSALIFATFGAGTTVSASNFVLVA